MAAVGWGVCLLACWLVRFGFVAVVVVLVPVVVVVFVPVVVVVVVVVVVAVVGLWFADLCLPFCLLASCFVGLLACWFVGAAAVPVVVVAVLVVVVVVAVVVALPGFRSCGRCFNAAVLKSTGWHQQQNFCQYFLVSFFKAHSEEIFSGTLDALTLTLRHLFPSCCISHVFINFPEPPQAQPAAGLRVANRLNRWRGPSCLGTRRQSGGQSEVIPGLR